MEDTFVILLYKILLLQVTEFKLVVTLSMCFYNDRNIFQVDSTEQVVMEGEELKVEFGQSKAGCERVGGM